MELEERRDVAFDALSCFDRSDATDGIRGHVVQQEDDIEKAE